MVVSPLRIAFLGVQNRKKNRRASRAEFSEFESVVTLFQENLLNLKRGVLLSRLYFVVDSDTFMPMRVHIHVHVHTAAADWNT